VADETTLREFPPLRAAWSRRGAQVVVVISGRNARRVVHGALNATTGELVRTVTTTSRTGDVVDAVAALGAVRPGVPKLLVWDNAPPHRPKRVREAAALAGIELAFLPFRSPELMPLEDLWRGTKGEVAANRTYATMDDLAGRAVAALDALTPADRLRRAGLTSSKFDWLPT
jgi:transposase